ncbi:Hsp70 family protein [Sphaerotilus sp.]|uniref:Hsp70 family protein n=1 Tax=Sphaerotilus sp. TaxID=2093942 RepID=UPI0034E27C29
MPAIPPYCAIDFGTSNSAVAVPRNGEMVLVPLEEEATTMPTATFYLGEGPDLQNLPRLVGRAAVAAYVEGTEGRLMRSMKSVLGSALMAQHTDIGSGRSVSFAEVIASYLRHLKRCAEAHAGHALTAVVMGRPVFFVDDDPVRDAQAQASLEEAARSAGFEEVQFQFEPLAAAFDYESRIDTDQRVLVADIGGGTSDFSIVQVGPGRRGRVDRHGDVLGHHGIHIAGTDFDRRIELASILSEFGFGAMGPSIGGQPAREVPSRVYHDLATWHLINSVYRPQRVQELRAMKINYADLRHHTRLMRVVIDHLGHDLLGRAEMAKIASAAGDEARIDLRLVERGLSVTMSPAQAQRALDDDIGRIAAAALETVRLAGLQTSQIDALYFTGGSTGLHLLTDRLAAAFPQAKALQGERLASVASGLGLDARRRFGL